MNTKIKTNRSAQAAAKSGSHLRGFGQFLVAIISLVGLIIAFFVAINLTPPQPAANAEVGLPSAGPQQLLAVNNRIVPVSINEAATKRTVWDHPRHPHLVETLASVPQRTIEAETVRYNGLATFYASEQEANTSVFQAANPELAVAQRYDAQVLWRRIHFPGR